MKNNEREPNIYEKKEGEESPAVELAAEINETQSVIAAEDIALAREEITQKIIHEDIPAEKWTDATEEVLKKYPQLEIYKDYFLKAVEETKKTSRLTNELWEKTVQNEVEISEDEPYRKSDYEEADEEGSKALFKAVFRKDAEEAVRAIKGRQCLIFELERSDIMKLGVEGECAFFEKGTKAHVPTIIFLSGMKTKMKGEFFAHENQHLQNALLNSAKDYFTLKVFDLPKELQRTSWRNFDEQFSPEGKAQRKAGDEILAHATYGQIVEEAIARSEEYYGYGLPLDFIKTTLIEGSYYEDYRKELNIEDPHILDDYKKKVSAAIDAFVRLTEIYEESFPGKTNRMAIDVLAQFPLSKWPGVVSLIERRRKSR